MPDHPKVLLEDIHEKFLATMIVFDEIGVGAPVEVIESMVPGVLKLYPTREALETRYLRALLARNDIRNVVAKFQREGKVPRKDPVTEKVVVRRTRFERLIEEE